MVQSRSRAATHMDWFPLFGSNIRRPNIIATGKEPITKRNVIAYH